MKTRIATFVATLSLSLIAAGIASADGCACGNSGYPVLVGSAYGICTYDYGPYVYPEARYRSYPC